MGTLFYRNILNDIIDFDDMHDRIFYFLSNENYEDEFIKSIAENLIEEGSRKFGFYGKYRNKWHQLFDEVDIVMNPDSTADIVAITSSYLEYKGLMDDIDCDVRTFDENTDIYLMYDDKKMLLEFKNELVKFQNEL